MKIRIIASHTSGLRENWWYLIQKDDGTLHVRHESDGSPAGKRIVERELPINEFMQAGDVAQPQLQKLIDRMFEDAKRS